MKYLIETDVPIVEYVEDITKELPSGPIFQGYNFTWEEVFGADGDAIKYVDYDEFEENRDKIILQAIMMQEMRDWLNQAVHVDSWLRCSYYNDVIMVDKGYATSKTSDHKEGRASDTDISPTTENINKWKEICARHNVYYSYGLYTWGMHLGYRFDRNANWDYR